MEDIKVKIKRKNREVNPKQIFIGLDGENLQENVIFSFEDEFVDGQARLDIEFRDETKGQITDIQKNGETYVLPIKSEITKYSGCKVQLVITEGTNENAIPIFKSLYVVLVVAESINASTPIPEGYTEWIDSANTKLNLIDEKLEDIDEAITETNNLDLDVGKEGKTATVTLTKKDATTKVVTLSDGTSLMFNWDGTKLGIKTDEDAEYTYVDLQGVQGPTGATPNIQIGTVVSGETPNVTRTGTNENPILNFTLVKGDKGDVGSTGPTGATGNGIASITKTSTEGLVDTYTITYTDGTTSTFQITNGEDGDVTPTEFNALKADVEDLRDNQIIYPALDQPALEGTNIHAEDAAKARLYEFEMDKESTQETTTGKNLFDKNNTNILNAQINRNTLKLVADGNVRTLWIEIQPNTTYTVSKTASARFRVATLSTQPQIDASITKYESDDSGATLTITSEANDYYLAVMYYNSTVDTLTEQEILNSIQIEQGTSPTEYEEYTGGQPSPNPDYPQEVKTVKGYRNLFDFVNGNYVSGNGATINRINGEYTITNSSSEYGGARFYQTDLQLKPNTNYIFSAMIKDTNSEIGSYVYIPKTMNLYNREILGNIITSNGISIVKFTTPEEIPSTAFIGLYPRGLNVSATFTNIMLVEGDQELPYVPYGNNYVNVKVTGKNLFNSSNVAYVNGKILNDNGVEINDNSGGYTKMYIEIKPNTKYTISGLGTNGTKRIYFFDKNKTFISRTTGYTSVSLININTPTNCEYIDIQFNQVGNDFNTYQIEENTEATTYEPYKETIVPIPLNGNEIVGIGNYLDELIVDKEGKVYLNKVYFKKIFDGSETWFSYNNYGTDTIGWATTIENIISTSYNVNNIFSNKFAFKNIYNVDIEGCNHQNKNYLLKINKNRLNGTTKNDFLNYLQTEYQNGTPLVLYYPLATPDPIDLNTTVDLKLFKYVNNISNSEDGNMRIRYVQNTQTVIDKKYNTLVNAIISLGGEI